MKTPWNLAFGSLVVLIAVICAVTLVIIAQLNASSACRERGGIPMHETWGQTGCAKPMEKGEGL